MLLSFTHFELKMDIILNIIKYIINSYEFELCIYANERVNNHKNDFYIYQKLMPIELKTQRL